MRTCFNLFLLLTVFCSFSFDSTQAKTIIISANKKDIHDTTLYSAYTSNNFGASTELRVGRSGPNNPGIHRTLIRFNLSSIPTDAIISAVTVQLHCIRIPTHTETKSVTQKLFPMTRSWNDGNGVLDENNEGQLIKGAATWVFSQYPIALWKSAGGDYASIPSAATEITKTGPVSWTSSKLISDVQYWVRKPDSNFGWMIIGDEQTPRSIRTYASSEDAAHSPSLIVTYTSPK